MKAKIEITMDNTAFEPLAGSELARILREQADRIEDRSESDLSYTEYPLRDLNGNTVGTFTVSE